MNTLSRSEIATRLLGMSVGALRARVLHAAAELGIADLLKDGPMTCDALAAAARVNANALYRLLRALAATGIFVELDGRTFALNETAQLLRSDVPESVRDLIRHFAGDSQLRTAGALLHSVRTGEPAFDHVHGMPFFEYLEQHADEARSFDSAMARFAADASDAVMTDFDFSRFKHVADVGGGNGQMLRRLLSRYPLMRGTLVDLPPVIESARAAFAGSDVANRIELVAADFFDALPRGADVFLLKHVIHDWDDERAVKILANCRRVLPANGRVLIVEALVAGPNEGWYGKLMDIGMLTSMGGAERTEAQYCALLERAGLRKVAVLPTASPYILIESSA